MVICFPESWERAIQSLSSCCPSILGICLRFFRLLTACLVNPSSWARSIPDIRYLAMISDRWSPHSAVTFSNWGSRVPMYVPVPIVCM